MAKYQITMSCGHVETHDVIGKRQQREWRISKLESELCSDCLAHQREKENQANAQLNAESGLPALTGSEKQIAWAETIRAKAYQAYSQSFHIFIELGMGYLKHPDYKPVVPFIEGIKEVLSNAKKDNLTEQVEAVIAMLKDDEQRAELCKKATVGLFDNTNSGFWIDNHRIINKKIGEIIAKNMMVVIDEIPTADDEHERQAQIEATIEATIYPNDNTHLIPVSIKSSANTISLNYNQDIYPVVSALGFKCQNSIATLECREQHGHIDDRTAELIAKLLEAGIAIRCYNAIAREKALNGDYEPYHKYWISQIRDGDMVVIPHFGSDDLYHKIRKIKGSKWSGICLVPVAKYDDILGFAKLNNYKITQSVLARLEQEREIAEHKILAPKNFVAKKARESIKEPEALGIDPELMDD